MNKTTRTLLAAALASALVLGSIRPALAEESPKSAWRSAGHQIADSFRQFGHATAVTFRKASQKLHDAFTHHGSKAPHHESNRTA
jgi:hypothetical protein